VIHRGDHGGAWPSKARHGYHATKPTGTTVSRPLSMTPLRPSRGKSLSWSNIRKRGVLISSVARGAKKARLPQKNATDSTIVAEANRLHTQSASHPRVTVTVSERLAHSVSPTPVRKALEAPKGLKPSVSKATQIGCGCSKVWSNCPRPRRRPIYSTL